MSRTWRAELQDAYGGDALGSARGDPLLRNASHSKELPVWLSLFTP